MPTAHQDETYLEIVLIPIRVCAAYKPALGHGAMAGLSLDDFKALYGADPFYAWFGLDNPLMYAAHKAAGGMTSIYRQLGIGCERLFRQILRDTLELTVEDTAWSYMTAGAGTTQRKLSLDARIPLHKVPNRVARARVASWISTVATELRLDPSIAKALKGVVFEVRQGYKSKDSKRQNADLANAATAYSQAYLPCVALLSTQIDSDIAIRYRAAQWALLTGQLGAASNQVSTYAFMKEVVGYDLAAFFKRNSATLRAEVLAVLEALLKTE